MVRHKHFSVRPEEEAESRCILEVGEGDHPLERTVTGSPSRRNVVFVLLESWSAHYVDCLAGRDLGVTPRFDALAAEGALFTRFHSAGQRSYEGMQATLTGLPPLPGLPTMTSGLSTNVSRP